MEIINKYDELLYATDPKCWKCGGVMTVWGKLNNKYVPRRIGTIRAKLSSGRWDGSLCAEKCSCWLKKVTHTWDMEPMPKDMLDRYVSSNDFDVMISTRLRWPRTRNP